ncbi:MAG: hypothetical protein IJA67_11055 [Oscillospiraceae bacterium]|nr:hypothetical protein [Oscillospiraceae bacterium]
MKNISDMERKLAASGKTDAVRAIAESKDGQKLLQKLDTGRIEKAMQSGDGEALRGILMDVLKTSEGRRIAQQLNDTMNR